MENQLTYDEQLHNKIKQQFETYRKWLLQQTPEEILNHTYEYTIKQDILCIFENEEAFTEENAKTLLDLTDPLEEIFEEFKKTEYGYIETLEETIHQVIDSVKEQ